MCGIVGYVGSRPAQNVLLAGLQRLEYRGYDSAGIAIIEGSEVQVLRCEGKLERLITLAKQEPLHGTIGIGHTRWATHGRPSNVNAHPHTFGKVTVVHNGIIENYRQLRSDLQERGHVFQSETDSEILAHTIADALTTHNNPVVAIRSALSIVDGVYALSCLIEGESDRLWCVRKDAPLIVGLGEGENFVASDAAAILHYTREMIFLEEGDLVEVRADGIDIFDEQGHVVDRESKEIQWSPVMAEKEGYKHFMLKEIFEQPRAIADTIRGRINAAQHSVDIEELDLPWADFESIYLIACGTSYHACLVAKFWIENLARIPCEVDLASEFRYRDPLIGEKDLFVAVSQSGETADTKAALHEAKRKGAKSLAIANVVDSSIPRESDAALYTYAGPEIGVASTKAFTTQLTALLLLALHIGRERGSLAQETAQEVIASLVAVPQLIQEMLRDTTGIETIAQSYLDARDWLFLGRGGNYPIALEGALKLKEISYAHAEGYPAGEMKHGPIALIDEHLPVVGICPHNSVFEKTVSNLQEVNARGGHLIVVTDSDSPEVTELSDHLIHMPVAHEVVQPILSVIPLQLLAYYVADGKGTDIDQPRNLAKSVTVE